MIAEAGFLCLVMALMFALLQTFIPTAGLLLKRQDWMRLARLYAALQFVTMTLSFGLLAVCFLRDDFSVVYVLQNSSQALPWFYKMCAVWGGHEGSILLWALLLAFWSLMVAYRSTTLELDFKTRVLVVLGVISTGFLIFIITTSNPFLRQFVNLEATGRDLNPLLQDPGFLFHPPMLYMGYVGFSVAFAYAIASLWRGRLDRQWAMWSRPWTLAAWSCLTLGITLGSWWAYRELGWGGFWFWDPVENASFMPWLVGTALIHSLAVTEKREQFSLWTLFLAITAFSLSLVGTFLVRSGVLTSVHAFAVDPTRGLYILCFLVFIIGGSLALFAFKAPKLKHSQLQSPMSREGMLLLNNVFLVVMMMSILLGTLYPLIIDGLGLGKLSVGAPYFNAIFVPLMLPMMALMSLAVHTKWGKDRFRDVLSRMKWHGLSIVLFAVGGGLAFKGAPLWSLLGILFAVGLILSTLLACLVALKSKGWSLSRPFIGMILAHIGVALSVLGVSFSSGFGVQKDVRLSLGQTTSIGAYQVTFISESPLIGPNYHGTRAKMKMVHEQDERYVYPEKRIYDVSQMPMTDSAIDVSPFRDIYVAMGEPLDGNAWSFRLYIKPMVRWIWAGGFFILFGGLLAMSDKRYFTQRKIQHSTEELACPET